MAAKIVDRRSAEYSVEFKELDARDCFWFDGALYMKMSVWSFGTVEANAARLTSAAFTKFEDHAPVRPVEVEIHIIK